MNHPKGFLLALLVCALPSCAPVILGRTPQPAPPGQFTLSLNVGYPFIPSYPNDLWNGPAQVPLAQPFNLFLAGGVDDDTELSGTLSFSLSPTLRLGGKTLLVGGAVPLAVDYGVSFFPLTITNVGVDAGLLFSYPQPGVEPYAALRGFIDSLTYERRLAGALTVGADVQVSRGTFFVELTAATTAFDNAESYNLPLPPFGFSIVPALGYRF